MTAISSKNISKNLYIEIILPRVWVTNDMGLDRWVDLLDILSL
jgi:hypothetical protein